MVYANRYCVKILLVKKISSTENIFKKFPLLTWLGAILAFLVIPLVLLNSGLESMLKLRYETEVRKTHKLMDDHLEFLLKHSNDAQYFHLLFKKVFENAINSQNPEKTLAKHIKTLRRRFPGHFKFIVWNSRGKTINSLTDEKSYRYVVKSIYEMFRKVAEDCRSNYPGYPESLDLVNDKINLFRGYLGRFLVPAHLRLPYQAGNQGRCILADTENRFPLFWFHSDPRLTLYCSISKKAINKNLGLKHAIQILNHDTNMLTGIIVGQKVIPEPSSQDRQQILFELGKFENASLPHRVTDRNLLAFKLLTPEIRGFCFIAKDELITGYPDRVKSGYFSQILVGLLLAIFVFYCYSLRIRELKFSIRFKLAILFLYANGLPLMIVGSIGYEYLQQQRLNLIKVIHATNEKLLLEIDSGYQRHRKALAERSNALLKPFKKEVSLQVPGPSMLENLKPVMQNLGADEIYIFNKTGQTLLSHKPRNKEASQTFMKLFSAAALTFANQKIGEQFDKLVEQAGSSLAVAGQKVFNRSSPILKTLLAKLDKIEPFIFGTEIKLCYATLLGDTPERQFHSLMILVWPEEEAQANYVSALVEDYNQKNQEIKLGAHFLHNGMVVAPGLKNEQSLIPVLQKAATLQSAYDENLKINDTRYIATALGGKYIPNISLVALTPLSRIEKQIDQLKLNMSIFALISMAIATGVALSLSTQFLIPVRQLSEAVIQIGKRNFRHRTRIDSQDEFGELGKVFNSSIAELEELEIGRVVQENLFPGNHLAQNSVQIYAKTVTMTKLGGDYYDFFPIDDDNIGIFMGDVAGHGIPAALIMAMGKASVFMCEEERTNPGQLLTSIHKMLFSLKSKEFKRMMTCQYMTLNTGNGSLNIANAGHCFPVVVSDKGAKAEYHEIIGTPVGILRRARYENYNIQLSPGDTVILYSDGMIEASHPEKGVFGAKEFLNLTKAAWCENLESYYQKMFETNQSWAEKQEDDLTMVLIRYNPTKVTP